MFGKVTIFLLLAGSAVLAAGGDPGIRYNFNDESEAYLNRQINQELNTSYIYHSMYDYFAQEDVALKGFARFFKERSEVDMKHAEMLQKYLLLRGGEIQLGAIKKPEQVRWGTGLEAMKVALQIEKNANENLLEVWKIGSKHGDPQLCSWLNSELLSDQLELIKKIASYITILKRVGGGLGEYQFDMLTLGHGHHEHH